MKQILAALVALSLVAAPLVIPVTANAWDGGFHRGGHPFHPGHFHHGGCCVFGGFAAGVFTGAVLGSAFAPVYAYPSPISAYPAPVYAPPPTTYWYFCRSLGVYYPYVPSCPEPWVPVPAQ
jgi:hypothetical protein